MLCAEESQPVNRLQEHFSLLPTKTFDLLSSCTEWDPLIDWATLLHFQNRRYVIPDTIADGEVIELDTFYFNECSSQIALQAVPEKQTAQWIGE